MSFGGHFGQPMPIATHRLIGQVLPYQRMHGDWHGLAEKAVKTDLSWQVCCAMVSATAACSVVVLCLSYDAQDVEYIVLTTPPPHHHHPQWVMVINPPIRDGDEMAPRQHQ